MKLVNNISSDDAKLNKKYLIPSIITMGIIPLIMHEHTRSTGLNDQLWYVSSQTSEIDFSLYYKQWAIVIMAAICIIILLVRKFYYYEELPHEKKLMIPVGIYMVMAFISACLSEKKAFAFGGGYSMYQCVFTLMSYIVIFYYTYTCIVSMTHLEYFLRWSGIFIIVEIILCFFQAVGLNFFNTGVGKALISDVSRWKHLETVTNGGSVCGTLYNPDFMSMYIPVIIPVFLCLFFIEKEKWKKAISIIFVIMSLFVQLRASTAGILGIIGSVVITFLVLSSRKKRHLIATIAAVTAVVVASVCAVIFVPSINDRIKMQFARTPGKEDSDVPIKSIVTGDEKQGLTIRMRDGRELKVTFILDSDFSITLKATDANGNKLATTCIDKENQAYTFDDSRYSDMFFMRDDSMGVSTVDLVLKDDALKPNIDETITNDTTTNETATYSSTNSAANGETTQTDPVADDAHQVFGATEGYCVYPFTNNLNVNGEEMHDYFFVTWAAKALKLPQEDMGEVWDIVPNTLWSGRGYIYNRTFPLLRKHIILGTGADNYVMDFPQSFYIRDNYIEGKFNSIDVKPHCYYMQVWIQEGLIALAALMYLIFGYLFNSAKLYRCVRRDDLTGVCGLLIAAGILGYMISAIANDSMTCTAPVFWTMLGVGFAVNKLYHPASK